MLGILGIIVSLAIIIVGAYKGWNIFPISLLGSVIIIFANGMKLFEGLSVNYAAGWMNWAGTYFLMFALGSCFGEVMASAGAAKSIAYKISDLIGAKNTPVAIAIITIILTYGGINSFVVAFTVYPLAMVMCNEANIPRSLAVAGLALGSGTITQGTFPGTPSTQNIIPTTMLGTTTTAAPVIGIVCSIFMFIVGIGYLRWRQKKYIADGIGFVAIAQDGLTSGSREREEVPAFSRCIIPIILVIIVLFATRTTLSALASVSLALFIGCVSTFILFWNQIADKKNVINKSFSSSIIPLMNTAAIIGYGSVVQASPAFKGIIETVKTLNMNPYATTAIGVNLIAGASGSASGGIRIFLESMGQHLLDKGVNAEALHRVTCIASSGLDTLPHNGAILSMLTIFGTNHKESYGNIFFLTVLLTIMATVIAVIMATIMYPV